MFSSAGWLQNLGNKWKSTIASASIKICCGASALNRLQIIIIKRGFYKKVRSYIIDKVHIFDIRKSLSPLLLQIERSQLR